MEWNLDVGALLAIAVAVVTLVRSFLTSRPDTSKSKTDALSSLWNLNNDLVKANEALHRKLRDTEKDRALQKSIAETARSVILLWHDGIHQLMLQLHSQNITPAWEPEVSDLDFFKELDDDTHEEA